MKSKSRIEMQRLFLTLMCSDDDNKYDENDVNRSKQTVGFFSY